MGGQFLMREVPLYRPRGLLASTSVDAFLEPEGSIHSDSDY